MLGVTSSKPNRASLSLHPFNTLTLHSVISPSICFPHYEFILFSLYLPHLITALSNCQPSIPPLTSLLITSSFVHPTLSYISGLILQLQSKFKLNFRPHIIPPSFPSYVLNKKPFLPFVSLLVITVISPSSICSLPFCFLTLSLPTAPYWFPPRCSGQRSFIYLFGLHVGACVCVQE